MAKVCMGNTARPITLPEPLCHSADPLLSSSQCVHDSDSSTYPKNS